MNVIAHTHSISLWSTVACIVFPVSDTLIAAPLVSADKRGFVGEFGSDKSVKKFFRCGLTAYLQANIAAALNSSENNCFIVVGIAGSPLRHLRKFGSMNIRQLAASL